MITKENITALIQPYLEEHSLFLVELTLSADGKIQVFVDGLESISIDQCVKMTRLIRNHFGEEMDNWALTVSSPGLDKPFRHFNQYLKNLDKSVEVMTQEGKIITGKLSTADPEFIIIQEFKPVKAGTKNKKPVLSDTMTRIEMDQVKQTKKNDHFLKPNREWII